MHATLLGSTEPPSVPPPLQSARPTSAAASASPRPAAPGPERPGIVRRMLSSSEGPKRTPLVPPKAVGGQGSARSSKQPPRPPVPGAWGRSTQPAPLGMGGASVQQRLSVQRASLDPPSGEGWAGSRNSVGRVAPRAGSVSAQVVRGGVWGWGVKVLPFTCQRVQPAL
jgi:hypothetical protein